MFDSDDVVFAWAILKALLIVIVGFGFLIYAAWAVIRQSKDAAQVAIRKDSTLKYKSSVQADTVLVIASGTTEEAGRARPILAGTSTEEINVHEPEKPAAAA